jgi:hypothetical protein
MKPGETTSNVYIRGFDYPHTTPIQGSTHVLKKHIREITVAVVTEMGNHFTPWQARPGGQAGQAGRERAFMRSDFGRRPHTNRSERSEQHDQKGGGYNWYTITVLSLQVVTVLYAQTTMCERGTIQTTEMIPDTRVPERKKNKDDNCRIRVLRLRLEGGELSTQGLMGRVGDRWAAKT